MKNKNFLTFEKALENAFDNNLNSFKFKGVTYDLEDIDDLANYKNLEVYQLGGNSKSLWNAQTGGEIDYAQNGVVYKSDRPVTQPRLSKLQIDQINQANQKRLFEENQPQLKQGNSTPITDKVRNIGYKVDRDKRINSRQDKANLLGLALSPVPVVGELYNSANVIADGIIDSAQGEYSNVAMSLIPYGLSKKINPNQNLTRANFLKDTNVNKAGLFDFNFKKPNNFQSEIDWSKWNKEIPENTQLMDEYNAIEQTTKANGTWMKNPNGSVFQGTPEQFVQQNSQNFKKAFPNILKDELDNIQINYHGSPNKFDTFDPMKANHGNLGFGLYTSKDKEFINHYLFGNPNGSKFELYLNAKNIQPDITSELRKIRDLDFDNLNKTNPIKDENYVIKHKEIQDKFFKEFDKIPESELNLKYNNIDELEAKYEDSNFEDRKSLINNLKSDYDLFKYAGEQISPFSNYPKSAKGNNGMFDMTNPNIYKSLVPIAGASYMMNQNNKQTGGETNNLTIVEDGEYVRDNQGKVGKITNIPSHDDNELIIDGESQYVPKGQGGQGTYNVNSVLSNSYNGEGSTNRNKSDDTYTQADEEITLKPQEALALAEQLNLSIKRPLGSISPSKLMDKLLESREKLVTKYKNIDKPLKSERQTNSFTANVDVLNSIPTPEDIYEFLFQNQENSKSENNEMYAQIGIQINPSKRGTFSAQATRMGMSVQEAARKILNAPEGRYTPEMRKKANFARNASSWNKQTGGKNVISNGKPMYQRKDGKIVERGLWSEDEWEIIE